jgi:hypothetical protein
MDRTPIATLASFVARKSSVHVYRLYLRREPSLVHA